MLPLLDFEFELIDRACHRGLHRPQLIVQTSQHLKRVTIGFQRLRHRFGRSLPTHGRSLLVRPSDRLGRRVVRLIDDVLRPRLRSLHQFVNRNLLLGILARLLRENRGFFLSVLQQAFALLKQSLSLISRCRRGHTQSVDQVEQLLAVNRPAGTESAASTGQNSRFDLVNQFEEIDDELRPRVPPESTVAQERESG